MKTEQGKSVAKNPNLTPLQVGRYHYYKPDAENPEGDWEWFPAGTQCDVCIDAAIVPLKELNAMQSKIQEQALRYLSLEGQAAELQARVEELETLVAEAPKFFSPQHDFDGEKLQWIQRAAMKGTSK